MPASPTASMSARPNTGCAPSARRRWRAPAASSKARRPCADERRAEEGRRIVTVTHDAALGRYEMKTEHGVAVAVYHQHGDRRVFTHTEVPAADEGKGYASRL